MSMGYNCNFCCCFTGREPSQHPGSLMISEVKLLASFIASCLLMTSKLCRGRDQAVQHCACVLPTQRVGRGQQLEVVSQLSDEVGKTIRRHHIIHRPTIGRYTSVEDTRLRELLLTPVMHRWSSKPSLKSAEDKLGSTATVGETTSRATGASGLLSSADGDLNLT